MRSAEVPDLRGINAMVTGGNSGIGAATVVALAEAGATVVIACRRSESAARLAGDLGGRVCAEKLDLASLASVRALAQRREEPLDLLVNNAGVMRPPRWKATADGLELQYGTNHIGHVALTAALLPALLAAPAPRVVTVSSLAHHAGDESLLAGNPVGSYSPQRAYGNSKLGNLLFARELDRVARLCGSNLVSTACHPGISATGLFAHREGMGASRAMRVAAPIVAPLVLQTAEAGSASTLHAATVAAPGSYSGPQRFKETRGPVGPAKLSAHALDLDLQQAAWLRALEDAETDLTFDTSAPEDFT